MGLINAKTVIGMDIGKKYSWFEAISTETGEVLKEERLINRREEFVSFLDSLPRPIRLVMEASGNSAYLCKYLEDLVEEIKIAHPFNILPYFNSQTFSSIDSMSPPDRAPMLTLIA